MADSTFNRTGFMDEDVKPDNCVVLSAADTARIAKMVRVFERTGHGRWPVVGFRIAPAAVEVTIEDKDASFSMTARTADDQNRLATEGVAWIKGSGFAEFADALSVGPADETVKIEWPLHWSGVKDGDGHSLMPDTDLRATRGDFMVEVRALSLDRDNFPVEGEYEHPEIDTEYPVRLSAHQREAMFELVPFASTDESRRNIGSVCLRTTPEAAITNPGGKLRIAATDGHRLAWIDTAATGQGWPDKPTDALLPVDAMKRMVRAFATATNRKMGIVFNVSLRTIKSAEIGEPDKTRRDRRGNAERYYVAAAAEAKTDEWRMRFLCIDDSYPDTDKVIALEPGRAVAVDAVKLANCFRIMGKGLKRHRSSVVSMHVVLGGHIRIATPSRLDGWRSEVDLPCESFDAPDCQIGVNAAYMAAAIKVVCDKGDMARLVISDEFSPMLITGDRRPETSMLVMPMRL